MKGAHNSSSPKTTPNQARLQILRASVGCPAPPLSHASSVIGRPFGGVESRLVKMRPRLAAPRVRKEPEAHLGGAAVLAAVAMEREGELLSARPALETEGLRFLHVTVGSLLAAYGWYILFSCVLLYVLFQKLYARLRAVRQRHLDRAEAAAVEPDDVVKRQEALAAARLKMQEELNAQIEKHKEKLRQLEEEKRRQKIEMWDSMQEGKSYKRNPRRPQEEDSPGPSTSAVLPKRKPDKKPLRGNGYNPLTGEGGGACSWRPGRRGPSSSGG